jgi:hypothetical protein
MPVRYLLAVPLAVAATIAVSVVALADQPAVKHPKAKSHRAGETAATPIVPHRPANPCAAFGAGFTRLPGSDTCVRIGGSLSVEGGGRF